jgi:hypothetical protein
VNKKISKKALKLTVTPSYLTIEGLISNIFGSWDIIFNVFPEVILVFTLSVILILYTPAVETPLLKFPVKGEELAGGVREIGMTEFGSEMSIRILDAILIPSKRLLFKLIVKVKGLFINEQVGEKEDTSASFRGFTIETLRGVVIETPLKCPIVTEQSPIANTPTEKVAVSLLFVTPVIVMVLICPSAQVNLTEVN